MKEFMTYYALLLLLCAWNAYKFGVVGEKLKLK